MIKKYTLLSILLSNNGKYLVKYINILKKIFVFIAYKKSQHNSNALHNALLNSFKFISQKIN
jgi:hypothetical protein